MEALSQLDVLKIIIKEIIVPSPLKKNERKKSSLPSLSLFHSMEESNNRVHELLIISR